MKNFNFGLINLLIIICFITTGHAESLDLDSTHQIFHFHGGDTTSRVGNVIHGLGDINKDGYDDISLRSLSSPEGTLVFFGGNPPDNSPDYVLRGKYGSGEYLDYDGDGIKDIVTRESERVLLFKGDLNSIDNFPTDSIVRPNGTINFGSGFYTGYINGDSIADILVTSYDPSNGSRLYYYENPFLGDTVPDWIFSISALSHSIRNVLSLDYNGNGFNDMIFTMQADLDTLSYVYMFYGPNFSSAHIPDNIIRHPEDIEALDIEQFAEDIYNVGDINQDGLDDLGVRYGTFPLVYLSGHDSTTDYDYVLDGKCLNMTGGLDINGDHYNDIIIGGSDHVWGRLILYLGENVFDTVRDDQFSDYDFPPNLYDRIGYRVSSAGDFNGDNFDDLLFSCGNMDGGEPGHVFVFSGGDDILVDVLDQNDQIPSTYIQLQQNYPNPFNPSTIIEFELKKRSSVVLTVFNILGERVTTLVNDELRVGSYNINWDGTNSDGMNMPTGIYFYRLQADDFIETKKMVLVK